MLCPDVCRASGANDNAAAAPKPVAATELSAEDLTAVTASVSALFAAHSVVSLDNVRTWLKTYSAKPAAAKAASLSDAALRGLLLRESVLEVKCAPTSWHVGNTLLVRKAIGEYSLDEAIAALQKGPSEWRCA